MNRIQMQMLKDALSAAESNIKMARNLFYQIEGERPSFDRDTHDRDSRDRDNRDRNFRNRNTSFSSDFRANRNNIRPASPRPNTAPAGSSDRELTGVFNGTEMVTESGEKHLVPRNYISKSMIVEGDTLKLVKDAGEEKFKQIRRVKRKRLGGTLMKKDGDYVVASEEGTFKIIEESVLFHKAKENDNITVLVPAEKKASWAVIEGIAQNVSGSQAEEAVEVKTEEETKTPVKRKAKKVVEKKESESAAAEEKKIEEVTPKASNVKEETVVDLQTATSVPPAETVNTPIVVTPAVTDKNKKTGNEVEILQ